MGTRQDNLLRLFEIKKKGAILTPALQKEYDERLEIRRQQVWEMLYPNQPMRLKNDGTEEQGDTDS